MLSPCTGESVPLSWRLSFVSLASPLCSLLYFERSSFTFVFLFFRKGSSEGRCSPAELPQRSVTTAPPVDLLVSKSSRGQRRQEDIRLAASRLAYDDLPPFTLLQSVSSGLVETGEPMAYFGDLDEDGFLSLSMAQA